MTLVLVGDRPPGEYPVLPSFIYVFFSVICSPSNSSSAASIIPVYVQSPLNFLFHLEMVRFHKLYFSL